MNAVLYLCSENATMEYRSFARGVAVSESIDRHGNPKKHRYWDIGVRFGKAFRASGTKPSEPDKPNIRQSEEEPKDRLSPRPHVRRAHWHYFWTGKRGADTRKLVLRWVHPVLVGNGELPTVVHNIAET